MDVCTAEAGSWPALLPAELTEPQVHDHLRSSIEQSVAQVFCVPLCDLRTPTRGRARVALARQVAMYLAHVACGLTLTNVGRVFDRDRTTVAHACTVIEDRRDEPVFDRGLDLLESTLKGYWRSAVIDDAISDPVLSGRGIPGLFHEPMRIRILAL